MPWEDRVKPGDLSPGDLLAPPSEDPRLVPGYLASGDPELDEVALEVGFGRRQVLSDWGRTGAAERWHDSDFGPGAAMARATKRICRDCGFYLPLAGALGPMFGVCANEMAADGHVVDAEYGCGAHSDTPAPAGGGSPLYDPYDNGVLDVMQPPTPAPAEAEATVVEEPAEPVAEVPVEPAADVVDEPAADVVDEPAAEPTPEAPDEPAVEAPEPTAEASEESASESPEEPTNPLG